MTKADLVSKISEKLGMEKGDVQATVESFMDEVKNSLESGDNVYLRGFGSFIIKRRAEKTGRNISKNTTLKFQLIIFQRLNLQKFSLKALRLMSKLNKDMIRQLIQKEYIYAKW